MPNEIRLLWADDEIDLLKPQLMFLEKKGYEVITVSNGHDAIEEVSENPSFDCIFLDESMPGLTGLETLDEIRQIDKNVPVVMITKNEAETLMDQAIGSEISDFLLKPVNPNQILLSLKKILDNRRLVREKTVQDYQVEFRKILMEINSNLNASEWVSIYQKIINWELRLSDSQSDQMQDILTMQKSEANTEFSKYIIKNYMRWMEGEDAPVMSHNLLKEKLFPRMDKNRPTILLLLDNLRYDQWMVLESIFNESFRKEDEDYFYSILPTATQYSRNAIFAGMMPADIARHFPQEWRNDNEEGGKNLYEEFFLENLINRTFQKSIKWEYTKISNAYQAGEMESKALNYLNNDLTVIVYNFIDMMSHARTEMEMLKELAGDERAYRSLTRSWFLHSSLWNTLQKLAEHDIQLFVTTDHGTIRVSDPSKVVGDRETTTNLRYKVGRNLKYNEKDVLEVKNPDDAHLPRPNVSSTYIFAKEDKFFLYPNNYNYYNNYYKNTFQHGGISLEEMICPFVYMTSK